MYFFDTHIHLQNYAAAAEDVISGLQKSGIKRVICVSASETDWPKIATLTDKFPDFIVPAFAVHPWYISEVSNNWAEKLTEYLKLYPQAAIGECGFDRLKNSDFAMQKTVFDTHINLACRFHRPLLIHAVKAWKWLEAYWQILPEKFVFHSFNAHPENLKNIIRNGGYVAVNECIFKSKTATDILKNIPADRLLFESDAPYQGRAENMEELCRKTALICQTEAADLAAVVYANAGELIK